MEKNKMRNAIARCLVMVLLLLSMASISYAGMEASGVSTVTAQSYNIMLLIDKSGSMNVTDGNGLARSAASQFVDQLSMTYDDLMPVSNVGVKTFDQTTHPILDGAMPELNEANRDNLKSEINKIVYNMSGEGGTDLGVAVYDAVVELQEKKAELSKNMIVMFTDGWTDAVDKEASKAKRDAALKIAEGLECEIFIVGLNHQGTIPQEGREEIYKIADTAQIGEGIELAEEDDTNAQGGKVNYLITDDIGEIREFCGEIYAQMLNCEVEFVDNQEFAVGSGGIREAVVTVYSNSEITGMSIENPDGNEVREDGKNCFISGDDYYKVIKLMDPDRGTWSVKVTSADEYKTYVIRFYGIEAAISATWGANQKFQDAGIDDDYVGKVVVTPMYKSEPYREESLADSMTKAEYTVSYEGFSETYPLDYRTETGDFVGYFPVQTGAYHITALLANDDMDRTAECDLNVHTDIISFELNSIRVKNGKSVDIDLEDELDVPNLDIQSVSTESSSNGGKEESISSADVRGTVLTVYGDKVGEDSLEIKATDADGNEYFIVGKVKVGFTLFWYHIVSLLIILAVIAIMAYVIYNKRAYVRGDFELYIENLDTGARLENTVEDYPRGKTITLWDIVKCIIDMQDDHLPESEKSLCSMLKKEQKNISAVKLVICNDGNKGRKKMLYKLEHGGERKDLKSRRDCYGPSPSKLKIRIKFNPLTSGFDDEEDDWAKPLEDISHKYGKIGRRPSRKTEHLSDEEDL